MLEPINAERTVSPGLKSEQSEPILPAYILLTASMVLNLLLLTVLIFGWSTSRDVRALTAELKEIDSIEQRISKSIQGMNSGIQHRLDLLQSGVDGNNRSIARLDDLIEGLAENRFAATSAVKAPSVSVSSEGPAANSAANISVQRNIDGGIAPAQAMFRRIVEPDGRVRYERR